MFDLPNNTEEMTDTERKRVAEAVAVIRELVRQGIIKLRDGKEEAEMHRAMARDDMQQVFTDVLRAERERTRNFFYEIFTWLAGKFKR